MAPHLSPSRPDPTRVSGRWRAARGRSGLAAAAVLAGVSIATTVLAGCSSSDDPDPRGAGAVPPFADGVLSVGRTIHLDPSGSRTAEAAGEIKQLYYTSAGVVVRTGRAPWVRGAGASDYAVLSPDGDVRSLDLRLGDVAPDTSAALPYLAWASPGGPEDTWRVHVLDVRTSEELTASVTGAFTWRAWAAPPVSIDGGLVYVGLDEQTTAVDFRSGELQDAAGMAGSAYPDVVDGRTILGPPLDTLDEATGPARVVDALTGDELLPVPVAGSPSYALSPDGASARIVDDGFRELGPSVPPRTYVLDLATGTSTTLARQGTDWGWTPGGGPIGVKRGRVRLCEPGGGSCRELARDLGRGVIRVGGAAYDS